MDYGVITKDRIRNEYTRKCRVSSNRRKIIKKMSLRIFAHKIKTAIQSSE